MYSDTTFTDFQSFIKARVPGFLLGHKKPPLSYSKKVSGVTETWANASAYEVRLQEVAIEPSDGTIASFLDDFDEWLKENGSDYTFIYNDLGPTCVLPRVEADDLDAMRDHCAKPLWCFAGVWANWIRYFCQKNGLDSDIFNRPRLQLELARERSTPGVVEELRPSATPGQTTTPVIPSVSCDLGFFLSGYTDDPPLNTNKSNLGSPNQMLLADETWQDGTFYTHMKSVLLVEFKQFGIFNRSTFESVAGTKEAIVRPGTGSKTSLSARSKQTQTETPAENLKSVIRQALHYCSAFGLYNILLCDYQSIVLLVIPSTWRFDNKRTLVPRAGVHETDLHVNWLHIAEEGQGDCNTRRLVAALLFHNMDQAFADLKNENFMPPALQEIRRSPRGLPAEDPGLPDDPGHRDTPKDDGVLSPISEARTSLEMDTGSDRGLRSPGSSSAPAQQQASAPQGGQQAARHAPLPSASDSAQIARAPVPVLQSAPSTRRGRSRDARSTPPAAAPPPPPPRPSTRSRTRAAQADGGNNPNPGDEGGSGSNRGGSDPNRGDGGSASNRGGGSSNRGGGGGSSRGGGGGSSRGGGGGSSRGGGSSNSGGRR